VKASEIVALARETLGTPYRHQGRVNGLALDCGGVPVHVAKRLGIDLSGYTRYGRLPVASEVRAEMDRHFLRVAKADMQIGDIVWMRFFGEPQHLGMLGGYFLGGFSLIHAHNGAGPGHVVEHRLDEQWAARIVAVWRFPGVEA
jgi:cell wall-associated NlpC family hydrolase